MHKQGLRIHYWRCVTWILIVSTSSGECFLVWILDSGTSSQTSCALRRNWATSITSKVNLILIVSIDFELIHFGTRCRFFVQAKKAINEKNVILQEVNNKHTDRTAFLQKASLLKYVKMIHMFYFLVISRFLVPGWVICSLSDTRSLREHEKFFNGWDSEEEVRNSLNIYFYPEVLYSGIFTFNLLDKRTPSQQALETIHSYSNNALLGSRGLRSLSHAKRTTCISGTQALSPF